MCYQLLCEELKSLSQKKKFREVIRLGNAISRVLWLNLEYESRVQIGHIVYEATIMENDEEARIRLLIDDIGWTNLFIGDNYKGDIFSGFSTFRPTKEWIVSENNQEYSSMDGVLFDKNKQTLLKYPNEKLDEAYIIPNTVTVIGRIWISNKNYEY